MEMSAKEKVRRLISFYGLGYAQVARLLDLTKRSVYNLANGVEPNERIGARIDHVLAVLDKEVEGETKGDRLISIFKPKDGLSTFRKLVRENPNPSALQPQPYTVAQVLGVEE